MTLFRSAEKRTSFAVVCDGPRPPARVLKPGHQLRFASDITTYVDWALQHMQASPHFSWTAQCAEDWRTPWEGWQSTRYEEKAFREGRKGHYLTFERVSWLG